MSTSSLSLNSNRGSLPAKWESSARLRQQWPRPELSPNPAWAHMSTGYGERFRAFWDHNISLPMQSKIATPAILLGSILLLIGIGGTFTALSGLKIRGFEFIMDHIPISLTFSLTLIRAGLHMIKNGTMSSRVTNRWRQETVIAYRLFQIQLRTTGMTQEEQETRLKEIARLDSRLPPNLRLFNQLDVNTPHGKTIPDISIGGEMHAFCREVKTHFSGLPALPEIPPDMEKAQPICWNKWYDFWYKRVTGEGSSLPGLGALDIAIGQVMLLTAISAFLFMLKPDLLPGGLQIFAKDPYLTITFGFILIGHFMNCTLTGLQMMGMRKREDKRSLEEAELGLIDLGLQKQFVEDLWEILDGDAQAALRAHKETFLKNIAKYEKILTQVKEGVLSNNPTGCFSSAMHKIGKTLAPKLPPFIILLGFLLIFFGIASLGMRLSGHVPDIFAWLTQKDATISSLLAVGLIIAGVDAFYKGSAIKERIGRKDVTKAQSSAIRNKLISHLFGTPELQNDLTEAPQNREALQATATRLSRTPYVTFASQFKKTALLHLILGLFLIVCSVTGLVWSMGYKVPDSMSFITQDSSFSGMFCVALLGVGLDSLNTFWRMWTYDARKENDRQNGARLREVNDWVFPQNAILA